MADQPQTAAAWTLRAIHEIDGGEPGDARQMLTEALRIDPDYETAWIWFGSIAANDAERRYCYQRAVEINPDSVVRDRLEKLPTGPALPPRELAEFDAIPLPEEFGGVLPVEDEGRRRLYPYLAIVGLLLAAIIGGVIYLFFARDDRGSPIYIAFAAGLTGSGSNAALEMEQGLRAYFKDLNSAGGVNGHPIELLIWDDQDNPDLAPTIAQEIVEDGRAVAVVGHRTSATSIAASDVYQAAGMPMISPTATATEFGVGCPFCFRTVFSNQAEGAMIAAYLTGVLQQDSALIIYEDSRYGLTLRDGVESVLGQDGGELDQSYELPSDPDQASDAIAAAIADIAANHTNTPIILATLAPLGQDTLIALRTAGLESLVVGGDALGTNDFLASVASSPGAGGSNAMTDGMFAAAPVFVDSIGGDAVRLAKMYEESFGTVPGWRSFTSAEAGVAVVWALEELDPELIASPSDQLRDEIRTRLIEVNTPEDAIPGFISPIYFDEEGTAIRPVAMGIAVNGWYASAQLQLQSIATVDETGEPDQIDIVEIGDQQFGLKRVVWTGVEINVIRDLNSPLQTFFADFFVWLKYQGDDNAADIVFVNSADPQVFSMDLIRSMDEGNQKYRVYRVNGVFKSRLDFHDFPFDEQTLQILYQNRTLPSTEIVYATDRDFIEVPVDERLRSGENSTTSINQIQNWTATNLLALPGSVGTTSSLGDPNQQQANHGFEISQMGIELTLNRNVEQFLVKNLLPLILVVGITYLSLFFSHNQTTERVSFGITGVLTGAVLLSSVVGLLPEVGYTVAIEWAFYAFILLSALCVLVALIGGRLNDARQMSEVRALDLASRIGYPLIVLSVVLAFWKLFG